MVRENNMRALLIVLGLAVAAAAQITDRQIEDAEATIATAEANLAALQGQRTADAAQAILDTSGLAAQRVQVLPYTADLGGMYVLVDVPYTSWTALQQVQWRLLLEQARALKVKPTEVVGRYALRKDRLPTFLARIKAFLEPEVGS